MVRAENVSADSIPEPRPGVRREPHGTDANAFTAQFARIRARCYDDVYRGPAFANLRRGRRRAARAALYAAIVEPILIEVVDVEEKHAALIPHVDELVTGGAMTLERVEFRRFLPRRRSKGLESRAGWMIPPITTRITFKYKLQYSS
jgi:hypothetical protein